MTDRSGEKRTIPSIFGSSIAHAIWWGLVRKRSLEEIVMFREPSDVVNFGIVNRDLEWKRVDE